jgi:hypothetical protein
MKTKILTMCLLVSASLAASQAWAVGEVLKVETYGKKFCANQEPIELDPTNSPTYWVQVDSDTQISLYFDPTLTQKAFTLPVTTTPLPDAGKRAVYAVDSLLGPTANGYFAVNGLFKTNNKHDKVLWAKLNFIRKGLIDACSSNGFMVGRVVP